MIEQPKDTLHNIEIAILNLLEKDPHSSIIHALAEAKTEIKNLRHHIESISRVNRITSTEMNDLLNKSILMVERWKMFEMKKYPPKSSWIIGKDA